MGFTVRDSALHRALGHSLKVEGSYRAAVTSGTLAAALAAGAEVFQFRWTSTSLYAAITSVQVNFQCLTLFSAGTLTDFGFDAFAARAFTAAGTGGNTATMTTNNTKLRTTHGTSGVGEIRYASTAALGAGTKTLDATALASSLGDSQRVNVAAGTEEQRVNDPTLILRPDISSGEHPLVLTTNEGLIIINRAVWPAAGTGIVQVNIAWTEFSLEV